MQRKRYVIVKSSRLYRGGPGYAGYTCELARLSGGLIYNAEDIANRHAAQLTKHNPVGFHVEEYQDDTTPAF